MYVGCAAEMPDKRGSFQSPDVPYLVVADVLVDEVGHFELFQPALGVHTLRDFVLIAFAEGFDQRSQQVLNAFLLFRIEVGHGDPGNLFCIVLKADTVFRWCLGNPGLGPLIFVERLVHAIGDQGLFPVDVPRMVFGFIEVAVWVVSIEDGPAEGDMLGTVAIATQGQVPSGNDEFKITITRFAKDGDRLFVAKAATIVI